MGQSNQSDKIILLFDSYSTESRNLYESFRNVGLDVTAEVIEDDGFLPDGIISVYGSFLGNFAASSDRGGKPRYFNELEIPPYWEITSSNSEGTVMDYNRTRARIFYAQPTQERLIRVVDWMDDSGKVRLSEHYNRYGALFCRTSFNKSGAKVMRSFFSAQGREVIVENFVTKDILLRADGQERLFRRKEDFVKFALMKRDAEHSRVFYNSLSYPFFTSLRLPDNGGRDLLFWSENLSGEIPGNMQLILNGSAVRTHTIYVQKPGVCGQLIGLGANPEIVRELGYVYSFVRENGGRPEALICTNSDRVERLGELAEALPEMHFHVAALTEMSEKLLSFERYQNVTLYPNVRYAVLDKLFEKCDYYFDINRENEIVDAVHRAFLNNMLIFGFSECAHNRNYLSGRLTYRLTETERMLADVREALVSGGRREELLDGQRKGALAVDKETFAAAVR